MSVCHQNDVGEYCGLSESELCVFCKLSPVGFLVVCECSSVLLQSVVVVVRLMSSFVSV